MFHCAIIITRNSSCSNISARPYISVSDIRKMINFNIFMQSARFDLNKITNFNVFSKFGTRTQTGIRAYNAATRDMCTFEVRESPNTSAIFNSDTGPKNYVLFNHGVSPDESVKGKMDRFWGWHCNADLKCFRSTYRLKSVFGLCQFNAAINAQCF